MPINVIVVLCGRSNEPLSEWIGVPIYRANAYYCKSSENPMVMEVIGTRVECITVVLLSGHGIKLSSEYSCLYTKINAATISLGQRSF